jgi:hypothetical protein
MKEARTFGQDFDEPSESAFQQYITWIYDKTNKKTASN